MKSIKKIILIITFFVSLAISSGTTGVQWLELETGIRAVGMGGAQTAAGRDISSSFYNPANISGRENDGQIQSMNNNTVPNLPRGKTGQPSVTINRTSDARGIKKA